MSILDFPTQGSIGTSLLPTRWDIAIYEGDTFDVIINFKDGAGVGIDLTGMTPLMEIKSIAGSVIVTPTLTLNYNSVNGALRIYFDTSAITPGTYSYDLQLTDSGGKTRTFIGGQVTVTGDISE